MKINQRFLKAIFGDDYLTCHVTNKGDWTGDYYQNYDLEAGTDQYFTISRFTSGTLTSGEEGAVRRIENFIANYCIVVDDVMEKIYDTSKLPEPSWVLQTSAGSQQWGYIWDSPVTSVDMVDNLLRGLVESLTEDGKDTGMLGVTRFVRLPGGSNTKPARLVDGEPFKCKLIKSGFGKHDINELAKCFGIDLYETIERKASGNLVDNDHPVLQHVNINRKKGVGKYDITCPWIEEHTNNPNSGTAIFTNADLSGGFKCNHGHCDGRTFDDVVNHLGIAKKVEVWKLIQDEPPPTELMTQISELGTAEMRSNPLDQVRAAKKLLEKVMLLPKFEHHAHNEQMRLSMAMSKKDFLNWSSDIHQENAKKNNMFYEDVCYITETDTFYDHKKSIHMTGTSYQRSKVRDDEDVFKKSLKGGIRQADKANYLPGEDLYFEKNGIRYINTWSDRTESKGIEGDISPWWNHFDFLGWQHHREHVVNWMAFTLQYPEIKINHALLLGGAQGIGKDLLLKPMRAALGNNYGHTNGGMLLSDFNEYAYGCKQLHINEIHFNRKEDRSKVYEKIKPLTAREPNELKINIKGMKIINVDNLVNCTINVNNKLPFDFNGEADRRLYAMWSDAHNNKHDELFHWLEGGGVEHVVYFLRNHDCSKFTPGVPPKTDWLMQMVDASKPQPLVDIEKLVTMSFLNFGKPRATVQQLISSIVIAQGEGLISHQTQWRDAKLEIMLSSINQYRKEGKEWVRNVSFM